MLVGCLSADDEQESGQVDQEVRLRCHDQSGRGRVKSCATETDGGPCLKESPPMECPCQSTDEDRDVPIQLESMAISGGFDESSFRGIMGADVSL